MNDSLSRRRPFSTRRLAIVLVAFMTGCLGRPGHYIAGIYIPPTGIFSSSKSDAIPQPVEQPLPHQGEVPAHYVAGVYIPTRDSEKDAVSDSSPPSNKGPTETSSPLPRYSDLPQSRTVSAPPKQTAGALLLYGGSNHDEFLGCLNCSEFDSESLCNEFGTYGSEFSGDSIWNEFSQFGSAFSSSSPWNEFAVGSDVPVVVDESGGFYGYLTINEYRTDAFGQGQVARLYKRAKGDLSKVRKTLCAAVQ